MLATKLIDGKARADRLLADVAAAAASLRGGPGIVPGLCAVLVGRDPASEVYVRNKGKAATAAGIASFQHVLPETTSEAELLALIATLNADDQVDGILVQLPLPKHIDPQRVIDAIDPAKDVDGFHAQNVGHLWSGGRALVPCTPYGCLMLLRDALPSLAGAEAIVLGRSNIVGKPMAALLLSENCTVTLVHSRSRDIPAILRRADILVAAVGRPQFVRGDWLKPGVIIIDVGDQQGRGRRRQAEARRRRGFCRGAGHRRRDHAGSGRRRPDDDRLPAAQHADRRLPAARASRAGNLEPGAAADLLDAIHALSTGAAYGINYRIEADSANAPSVAVCVAAPP